MSRARDPYIDALAGAANELFADGVNDPSITQILTRYWGEDKVIPQGMVGDAKKRMSRIRDVLEEDGHQLCPLADTYYRRYHRVGAVKSKADARLCLAIGNGKGQEGFLRLTGNPDHNLIWREWESIRANQAAGKVRRSMNALLGAVDSGRITEQDAYEVLESAQRLARPDEDKLPIEQRVMTHSAIEAPEEAAAS